MHEKKRRNISLAMAIIGAIITLTFGAIIIIGLIMNSHLAITNPLYYTVSLIGLFLISPIGIIISIYRLYDIRKSRKGEKRRNKFLVMVTVMPIVIFLFLGPVSSYILMFLFHLILPIGIIIMIVSYRLFRN
ncbi:MAG: hypothetical protein ACFFG0_27240 [Candidatus Thorarchaeota archaeon]